MGNKSTKILTLSIIYQHPKILLGMKKRGFGQGRWNGFGGKVGEGETVEEAAKRELLEEAGLAPAEIEKMGVIDFEFRGNPEILQVHIFKAINFEGEPKESKEMKPQWFDVAEIPFNDMWPDDKLWLPLFLADKKFQGRVLFDKTDNILEHELMVVKSFNKINLNI